jgi:hemerythrin
MSVSWKRSFNIGILEIDSQHRELFTQLDRLEAALHAGKGAGEIIETFRFLDSYVRRHFRAEEELQQLYSYPHLAMHFAEHMSFITRLTELESRLTLEGPSEKLAVNTNSFLTQWLISHVTTIDKQLSGYIDEARTRQWEQWLVSHF